LKGSDPMKKAAAAPRTVDEYIQSFPAKVQEKLRELRETIRGQAPQAVEKVSYRMPAYYLKGYFLFFAGFAKHIGFYPLPSAIKKFKKDLTNYKTAKGSVQFPINEPLPIDLIKKIVKFRVAEKMKAGL
jgi:uncharacterized protein YdhG (YjbR/CyaY superfamily)